MTHLIFYAQFNMSLCIITLADANHIDLPRTIAMLLGASNAAIADLKVKGTYLGPYTVSAKIRRWNSPFGFPIPMGPIPIKFECDPAEDSRIALKAFNEESYHLGWQRQSSFVDKLVNDVLYPTRWSTGEPVVVSHLYSPAADNFLSKTFDRLRSILRGELFSYLPSLHLLFPTVTAIAGEILRQVQDELDGLYNTMFDLDQEWSNDGDVTVEAFSQKGINRETGFDPDAVDRDFDVLPFSNSNGLQNRKVTHINLSKLNPDYAWETGLGADVARELGVTITSMPRVYLANGTVAQTALRSSASGDRIAVSFTNNSIDTLYGFSAEYYTTADSSMQPSLRVLNSGGLSLSMNKCTGNLYLVRINATNKTLKPEQTIPSANPVEFQLYYMTGKPWNYVDDFSYANSDDGTLTDGLNVVVRDTSGRVVSGIEPDSTDIRQMAVPVCEIYSKERADWDAPSGNTQSQPSLSLRNTGSSVLNNVHLFYFFTTLRAPQLRVYWMEQMSKATVTLDTLAPGQYAAHIYYKGINLHPGERINNIDFEINNKDWSLWNYSDDPSFAGSDTLIVNLGVLALDDQANRVCGIHPGEYDDGTDIAPSLSLAAKEESMYPNQSIPRIRIQNSGSVTIPSFKIYYYFTIENGKTPVCDAWDAPGCVVTLENLGAEQYRIVCECANANVEPGDYFPNSYGALVGLHYTNWDRWDFSNDYSAQGLGSCWFNSQKIVVEDFIGNVLWGAHP